jgi:hypothetical protein
MHLRKVSSSRYRCRNWVSHCARTEVFGAGWILAVIGLFVAGPMLWTKAQSSFGSRLLDPAIQEELTVLAAEDPEAFSREIEKYKTAEDRRIQEIAHLGITNAPAYFDLFPKSAEEIISEAVAADAMAHPITVEESLQRIPPNERLKAERELHAILNPPGMDRP